MLPILFAVFASHQPQVVANIKGEDVGLRIVRQNEGLQAEFVVYNDKQVPTVVAISTRHSSAEGRSHPFDPMQFDNVTKTESGVVLSGGAFSATIDVPKTGGVFSVAVQSKAKRASLKDAVFSVSFAPHEKPARATSVFAPSSGVSRLVTQEHFATPLAIAIGDGYGLALMPDVGDLSLNRPMNPVLMVDNDGRVSSGAILSYGFVPYDRDDAFNAVLSERILDNADSFGWKFDLLLADEASVASKANEHLWSKYGRQRFLKPLPQTVPFRYYTKPTYDMESIKDRPGNWWVGEGKGMVVRAPLSADGLAWLTADTNLARFAFGLKWWGDELLQRNWSDQADEVMNLIISAPQREGKTPISFDSATESWRHESFDVSATAVTARFKLKYIDAFSHEEEATLVEQVEQAARYLAKAPMNGTSALFLYEFVSSKSAFDEGTRKSVLEALRLNKSGLVKLGQVYARQFAVPSIETVSTALFLARSGETVVATDLVERIYLHQAVYQPASIRGTEIFGAFVAEHLVSEAQSDYTADLLDTVLTLGKREYAERSVAALRAPLALFAHPTHGISGLQLPSFIPALRSSPWFGIGSQPVFGPWRGVAEGIGQTLTSFAIVTEKYGSVFTHKNGWTVGIDGIQVVDDTTYNAFSHNPLAFEGVFPYEHVDDVARTRTKLSDPPHFPAMRTLTLVKQTDGLFVAALLGFTLLDVNNRLSGEFVLSNGSVKRAEFLSVGLGSRVTAEDLASGTVSFRGRYEGFRLSVPSTALLAHPPMADAQWPTGWIRMFGLVDVIQTSVSIDSSPVVSTADDGRGSRSKALTGVIESQKFVLLENGLTFTLYGDQGQSLFVELVDVATGVVVASAQKRASGAEELTWELNELVGATVVFRLVDNSKTGAIEVAGLRAVMLDPN